MKKHVMSIDIKLLMPDDFSVVEARKMAQRLISGCRQIGVVGLEKFSNPRPLKKRRTKC